MFSVNYRELNQMYRSLGPVETCEQIREWLEMGRRGESGGLRAEEFSIRQMAEALVPNGREWVESLRPNGGVSVMEADAVDLTAFANISGQIAYTFFMREYMNPAFVFSRLIPNQPTRFPDGEKVPGTTGLTDSDEEDNVTHAGMPGLEYGYGEDYIETPALEKRNRFLSINKETIWADRTGLFQRDSGKFGQVLGLRKEKRLVDVVIGATNPYSRQGTTYNTYQTSTPWINDHSNPLVDWTDIDAALQLFAGMSDPNTGEPILVEPRHLVCVPANAMAARRVLNATEIRFNDGASNTTQTVAANPVAGAFQIEMSTLAYRRIISKLSVSASNAAQYWFLGDLSRAFVYMEGWPATLVQAPDNHNASFERDIQVRFKVTEFGVPAVLDPRYVVRNKN